MKPDQKNQLQLKRWMVISLIPLAYLLGYANAEDELIEKFNQQQRINKQLMKLDRSAYASRI